MRKLAVSVFSVVVKHSELKKKNVFRIYHIRFHRILRHYLLLNMQSEIMAKSCEAPSR